MEIHLHQLALTAWYLTKHRYFMSTVILTSIFHLCHFTNVLTPCSDTARFLKLIFLGCKKNFSHFIKPCSKESTTAHSLQPDKTNLLPLIVGLKITDPSSHLSFGLSSDLFPSGFPTKTRQVLPLFPCVVTSSPSHICWSDRQNNI